MKKALFACFFVLSFSIAASTVDGIKLTDRKVEKGVTLENAKVDDIRIFRAEITKTFEAPIELVASKVKNFDEKCNNKHRRKRVHLDRKIDCPYFNKNLIESYVIKDIKMPYEKEAFETDRWVIKRLSYNQGTYRHNDVVIIKEHKNKSQKKVIEVTHEMIPFETAKKYIDSPVEGNSPFDFMKGHYTVTELSANKTQVQYVYIAKTDHFILSKDLFLGQVEKGMIEGNVLNMKTITDALESHNQLKLKDKVSLK